MSGIPEVASYSILPPVQTASVLGKGEKAARDFEAQLIGTVLQSLEKTFADLPGQSKIPGQDDYNYLGSEALASGLAAHGGFGIARMISNYFERTQSAQTAASPAGAKTGVSR
jgi:Rod binding domain-containing protein